MENSHPNNTTSPSSSSSSTSTSAPSPSIPAVTDVETLHRHIQQRLANIWRECEVDNTFQLIAPPSAVDRFVWPPFDLHMKSLLSQQLRCSSSSTSSSMSVSSASSHKRKRGVDQGEFTSHAIVKLAHGWKAWNEQVRGKGTIRYITSHSQGGETNDALPSSERMDTDMPSVSSSPSPSPSSSVLFDLPTALSSWAQLLVDRFNRSIKTSTPDSYIFDGVTVHHERGYINFFVEPKRLATLINNQLSAQSSSSAISSSTVSAASSSTLSPSFAPSPSMMAASATSPHLGHSSLFSFDSIGFLRSVYKEKHGTPRQGCVVHGARSSLTLHGSISSQALDGLDEFDHVWLMFVFHHNGPNPIASAKVTPPRANGQRVGIFATRTPHRPNPIGLSLARLDRIEGSTVYLSGLDLIEGTPVIDIKPYHPADCIPHGLYITPPWVKSIEHTSLQVEWTARAIDQLHTFMDQSSSSPLASSSSLPSANKFGLEFYSSNEFSLVHSTLTSLIAQDPRTLHSKARHSNGIYGIQFVRLDVCFAIKEEKQSSDCTGEGQSEDEPSTNTPTLSPSLASSSSPSSSLPSALIFHLVYHPPTTGRENVRPRLRTVEWLETIREEIQAIEEWRNGKQA